MSTANGIETEVKIQILEISAAQRQLTEAGFAISVPRRFEANTVYDTTDLKLKSTEMLLRLRQVGAESIVTWKGPGVPGRHKARPEIETAVGSAEKLDQILRALGYEPTFRYEKYRTEYKRPQARPDGVATLDETPIGNFLELEGPGDWIDQTAFQLGFNQDAYVLTSYGKLYLEYCATHGLKPSDMVFPAAH
jgi:adenylate cyclase, class 2